MTFTQKQIFCCIFLFARGLSLFGQNPIIDSLKNALANAKTSEAQFATIAELAVKYIYIKPDQTIEYGRQALAIGETLKDEQKQAVAKNLIGYGYWGKSNATTAFSYFKESLEYAEKHKDEVLRAKNLQHISNIYNQSGYYIKAIALMKEVIPIYEQFKVTERLPLAYNSMAYSYIYLKNYDSARRYLTIALPIAKEINSIIYPTILFNHADLAFKENNYAESKQYLQQSLALAIPRNDMRMKSRCNQLMAEINLKEGNIDTALAQAKYAVETAEQAGIKESSFPSFLTLSRASEAKGELKQAIAYLQLHNELKDSVKSRDIASTIGLYEFDQQQNRIAILGVEKKQQQTLVYGLIITALLLSALLFYLNRHRQSSVKSNKLLAAKNKEIEQQALELKELNEVKSKLFSIIAHDLRSPLASIISILRLLEDESISPEELIPHLPALSQNVGETLNMLDNLLVWSKSQLQGVSANPEQFSVKEVVQAKIKLYEQEARRKGIDLSALMTGEEMVYADKNMIAIILQNLINNAVKFTSAKGTIHVSARNGQDGKVTVAVSDNGKGMSMEDIYRILNGQGFTSEGTAQEKGLGIGFQICKEFVAINNGKLEVESKQNEGTIIKIVLPGKA
jgi:two-component system, sensor histidine kinase and response regulator